jgi:hypothetical protein
MQKRPNLIFPRHAAIQEHLRKRLETMRTSIPVRSRSGAQAGLKLGGADPKAVDEV